MAKINYKRLGKGKSIIILMHEWMGDHTNYELAMPYLNTDDFTWIFVDFRGYGLSKNIKGEYSLTEACEDIISLINSLDFTSLHLVGHSMSSLIAQKLSLILKQRLNTLILITPIPPTGIKMKKEAKQKLLDDVKNENKVIEQVVEGASKRYNNTWKKYRKNLAKNCSTLEAKLGYMNMYLSNDFSREVRGSLIKTRVIVGKYDLPAFHKNSVLKEFIKYYKNFELIECQEAGHYPMIECPVYFATKIEEFIKTYSFSIFK